MGERTKWLVSTEWLEAHLDSPDVVILDGSWYLPHEQRDPEAEYRAEHIPGALYFDMDAIADLTTDLPHMLPSATEFSAAVQKLGISNGQTIVIYDCVGLRSSPRIWWTFLTMGVQDVCILDGGLPKWKAEGRPVSDLVPSPHLGRFTARLDHSAVRDYEDVHKAINAGGIEIIDARSQERWQGTAQEPRPNIPSGRFPGSKNVPFPDLIDESGCLKDVASLRQRFVDAGVDLNKPVITSCGSGATAAILTLALDTIGHKQLGLYDGSWAEWAAREGSLIDCEPGAAFGPNKD